MSLFPQFDDLFSWDIQRFLFCREDGSALVIPLLDGKVSSQPYEVSSADEEANEASGMGMHTEEARLPTEGQGWSAQAAMQWYSGLSVPR